MDLRLRENLDNTEMGENNFYSKETETATHLKNILIQIKIQSVEVNFSIDLSKLITTDNLNIQM